VDGDSVEVDVDPDADVILKRAEEKAAAPAV
jgi:hypothetical protein